MNTTSCTIASSQDDNGILDRDVQRRECHWCFQADEQSNSTFDYRNMQYDVKRVRSRTGIRIWAPRDDASDTGASEFLNFRCFINVLRISLW